MACFHRDGTPYARFTPPPRPKCAPHHNDPRTWTSGGFDNRGHEKIVCTYCKRLIGYRDPKLKEVKHERED